MKYTEMKHCERHYFNSYNDAQIVWRFLTHMGIRADLVKAIEINPNIFDENDYFVFMQKPDVLEYNN